MAVTIVNTNYDGEVLDRILTKAATGNELVQKGLINLVPNVSKKYSIPRLKTSKMLFYISKNLFEYHCVTVLYGMNRQYQSLNQILLISIST